MSPYLGNLMTRSQNFDVLLRHFGKLIEFDKLVFPYNEFESIKSAFCKCSNFVYNTYLNIFSLSSIYNLVNQAYYGEHINPSNLFDSLQLL